MEHNREHQRFVLVCGMILLLMLALKLPSLSGDRGEDDERIYWSLANNWLDTRTYSLRGTDILPALPKAMYDQPLFHHPPMLTFLLIPFAFFDAPGAAIAVPWLGHSCAAIGVAVICWSLRRRGARGADFLLWLPVLAIAMDPIFMFAGRKLWPDTLVGGFAILSVGLSLLVARGGNAGWAVVAGVFAAFAGLTKLTGLICVPIGVMVLLVSPGKMGVRLGRALALLVPCAVLIGLWFAAFYREYGVFLPAWIQPDAELRAMSPHIDRALSRSLWYYPVQMLMLAPVTGVLLIGLIHRGLTAPKRWDGTVAAATVWIVVGLLMMLYLQPSHGAHMRFLSPIVPGWYMLMAALLSQSSARGSVFGAALLMVVVYGVSTMGFFLVQGLPFDDIVTVPELLYWQLTAPSGG